MPRYSASGAIRRCHAAAPVHRTGANLSPANMCCPPAPGQEPPGAVLREQGCHSRSWQGGDRRLRLAWTGRRLVPCCRQRSWPSADGPRVRARSGESRRPPGETPSHGPRPNTPRSSASAADRSSGHFATPLAMPQLPLASADMRSQRPRHGRQHQPKARGSTRASRKFRRRRSSGCARCGLAR